MRETVRNLRPRPRTSPPETVTNAWKRPGLHSPKNRIGWKVTSRRRHLPMSEPTFMIEEDKVGFGYCIVAQ